jgi:hypothetical protein
VHSVKFGAFQKAVLVHEFIRVSPAAVAAVSCHCRCLQRCFAQRHLAPAAELHHLQADHDACWSAQAHPAAAAVAVAADVVPQQLALLLLLVPLAL